MNRYLHRFFLSVVVFFAVVGVVFAAEVLVKGDANGDGRVTLVDFEVWRTEYIAQSTNPTTAPTSTQPTTIPTQTPDPQGKKLILHNWPGGAAMSPQYVRDNAAWFETERDFLDGVAVIFSGANAVMRNTPTTYQSYMSALAPLKDLPADNLTTNYALVFNNKPADVFDDWSGAIANWKNLAKAVKDTGMTGIMFDNEEYFDKWDNYPEASKYTNKSLKEYQDQTRLRGKQVMEAIISEYPAIHIIVLHGPYISEPKTPDPLYNWVHASNELKGPFFAGMLEGKNSTAKLTDGGEMYGLRGAAEFAIAYDWQRNGIASNETNSAFIPPSLRPIWRQDIDVSYGVYNQKDPGNQRPMTPAIFKETLITALRQADSVVWIYTDSSSFVNLGSPRMGDDWMQAAREAKNSYDN